MQNSYTVVTTLLSGKNIISPDSRGRWKMAYQYKNAKGDTYYLHRREVTLRGGRKQIIHYFSREMGTNTIDEIPEGFEVEENVRTGLPYLKRKG